MCNIFFQKKKFQFLKLLTTTRYTIVNTMNSWTQQSVNPVLNYIMNHASSVRFTDNNQCMQS